MSESKKVEQAVALAANAALEEDMSVNDFANLAKFKLLEAFYDSSTKELRHKDEKIEQQEKSIVLKDRKISMTDQMIKDRDAQISEQAQSIVQKDNKITNLEKRIGFLNGASAPTDAVSVFRGPIAGQSTSSSPFPKASMPPNPFAKPSDLLAATPPGPGQNKRPATPAPTSSGSQQPQSGHYPVGRAQPENKRQRFDGN